MSSPYNAYQRALEFGFHEDAAQYHAVTCLQRCYESLQAGEAEVRGVYLWGPVGRGKTWLMDRFYDALTVPARRQHSNVMIAAFWFIWTPRCRWTNSIPAALWHFRSGAR